MTPSAARWSVIVGVCFGLLCAPPGDAQSSASRSNHLYFDASPPAPEPETGFLHAGGTSATGHVLSENNQYFLMDGHPWLPTMGELHFSRVPEDEWDGEVAKMQASGLQIVSTYIFWNHHEEIEGQFDWTGRRDLRHFIQVCARHHMYVVLRIGPWVHGEARYGGLPDWVVEKSKAIRTNDPVYLDFVKRFFDQIGMQVQGLLWKDGGPVLGVQLENEYGLKGPGAGVEHISRLEELAVEAGLTVPVYTVTAWPSYRFPPHEMLPMLGGYPDGFWSDSLTNEAPKDVYAFSFQRKVGDMGAMGANAAQDSADPHNYPFATAESGAGMEVAYHRRPLIQASDITSLTVTGLGSGINWYGYYMFHGGLNPPGKLITLQESQKTGYYNDLPVVSYDFQAPIGAFGQERESYRELKAINLFIREFGSILAPMVPVAPTVQPMDEADTSIVRAAVRCKDGRGFLFINNYIRQHEMPERKDFQATIHLNGEDLVIPSRPVTIPSGQYMIWPFHLQLNGTVLRYSTAQLISRTLDAGVPTYFFFAVPGVSPEFSFNTADVTAVHATKGDVQRRGARELIAAVVPGRDSLLTVTTRSGQKTHIVILSKEEADNFWMTDIAGKTVPMLSGAALFVNDDSLHLRSADVGQLSFLQFGNNTSRGQWKAQDGEKLEPRASGLWTKYSYDMQPVQPQFEWKKLADAGSAPLPHKGSGRGKNAARQVLEVPSDDAFDHAAVWSFSLPQQRLPHVSDILLTIRYQGDIGRVYVGNELVDDDFFHGAVWQIGLKGLLPQLAHLPMEIKILPLRTDAPLYLDPQVRSLLPHQKEVAAVQSIKLTPEYEAVYVEAVRASKP